MASTDFPEVEREDSPAERAADSQPSVQDYSTEDLWDLNRKLLYATEHFDQRVINQNQKAVADAQAQALFWQNIEERRLAAKLASQELKERADFHQIEMQRAHQSLDHQATLNNLEYAKGRDMEVLTVRTIEPTREESAQDIAALSAVRQVTDVNVINTLSELLGVVQGFRTQMGEVDNALQALAAAQVALTKAVASE